MLLLVGVSVVLGLFAGASASGEWREYLLWRNGGKFGDKDAYFKKDVGLLRLRPAVAPLPGRLRDGRRGHLPGRRRRSCTTCTAGSGCRRSTDRLSGAAQVQISVLLGLFVLAKAADYWLDRFDLLNEAAG